MNNPKRAKNTVWPSSSVFCQWQSKVKVCLSHRGSGGGTKNDDSEPILFSGVSPISDGNREVATDGQRAETDGKILHCRPLKTGSADRGSSLLASNGSRDYRSSGGVG